LVFFTNKHSDLSKRTLTKLSLHNAQENPNSGVGKLKNQALRLALFFWIVPL
jgi:hypothetical protein